jgi:hypothetical protein
MKAYAFRPVPALFPSFTWSTSVSCSCRVVMKGDLPVSLFLHTFEVFSLVIFIMYNFIYN